MERGLLEQYQLSTQKGTDLVGKVSCALVNKTMTFCENLDLSNPADVNKLRLSKRLIENVEARTIDVVMWGLISNGIDDNSTELEIETAINDDFLLWINMLDNLV
jgi:hypothetical protein